MSRELAIRNGILGVVLFAVGSICKKVNLLLTSCSQVKDPMGLYSRVCSHAWSFRGIYRWAIDWMAAWSYLHGICLSPDLWGLLTLQMSYTSKFL